MQQLDTPHRNLGFSETATSWTRKPLHPHLPLKMALGDTGNGSFLTIMFTCNSWQIGIRQLSYHMKLNTTHRQLSICQRWKASEIRQRSVFVKRSSSPLFSALTPSLKWLFCWRDNPIKAMKPSSWQISTHLAKLLWRQRPPRPMSARVSQCLTSVS